MFKETLLMLTTATLFAGAGMAARHGERACSLTSSTARNACRQQAGDDYWIAVGICRNVANENALRECRANARESLAGSVSLAVIQKEDTSRVAADWDPE
jgi:hypothetical protein